MFSINFRKSRVVTPQTKIQLLIILFLVVSLKQTAAQSLLGTFNIKSRYDTYLYANPDNTVGISSGNTGPEKLWSIVPSNSGTYQLVNVGNEDFLTGRDDIAATISLNSNHVKWELVELTNGNYRLKNFVSDNLLSARTNGTTIFNTLSNANSSWELIPAKIVLPLEVIGADNLIEGFSFDLDDPSGIDNLYMRIHRPVYRDISTNPQRGAKVSVRINDGNWIDISNETVDVYDHEKAYGGLNGSYHTVRMNLSSTNWQQGKNTVAFRFNGTDGFTSGFRVIEMNVRKGNTDVIPSSQFYNIDPTTWEPPLSTRFHTNRGQTAWETHVLEESPLNTDLLKAKCASCHAADGRDLKYFNYSSKSIIARAKYHGLSELAAVRIATYIRSLDTPAPPQAQPWNPPYQPGPGIDSKPQEEWSAGAGLDAVLEEDIDMISSAFGGNSSLESIKDVMDISKTQNARETRLPIQLPDWNEWLTEVHPIDAPRIGEDLFYNTPVQRSQSLNDTYEETLNLLDNTPISDLVSEGTLKTQMNNLANQITNLSNRLLTAFNYTNDDREGISSFIMKWGAVKTWEIMEKYELNDKAPLLFESGEPRSWLSQRRNVFEIAPHRSANNNANMSHQDITVGKYFSTIWYHLQLVINGGNRATSTLWPVDWNYQPNHIIGLHTSGDGPKHPLRYAVSHAKMYQQFDDGKPVETSGIGFRQIHPGRYAPINSSRSVIFSDLDDGLRARLFEGLLEATMDLIETHDISEWPRDTSSLRNNTLRPATYTPKLVPANRFPNRLHFGHRADCYFTMIPSFIEAGVSASTMERVIAWGESMWPLGDWDSHRQLLFDSVIEKGTFTIDQSIDESIWLTINTEKTYQDPVVILSPISNNGGHPVVMRMRNVGSQSFEVQLKEWDYLDGAHGSETVSYMVLESGRYQLEDGTHFIAGNTSGVNHLASVIDYNGFVFDHTPVVLAQCVTHAGPAPVVTNVSSVSNNSFEVKLKEEERLNPSGHARETISWIAFEQTDDAIVESKVFNNIVDHNLTTIDFSRRRSDAFVFAGTQTENGADPYNIRLYSQGNFAFRTFIQEEASLNDEINHVRESLGIIVLSNDQDLLAVKLPESSRKGAELVGLASNEKSRQYSFYPNPTSGYIMLSGDDVANIKIFSIQGKEMQNTDVSGSISRIDLNEKIVSDIYILRITDINGQTHTDKLIVR